MDKETTHDHIVALKHELDAEKHIKREQVFSVFVEANPELNAYIAKNYGEEFGKIQDEDTKKEIMDRLGQLINLKQLTHDINHGKVDVAFLSRAVDGKEYVAGHEGSVEKTSSSLMARAVEKCVNLARGLHTKPEMAPTPAPAEAVPPLKANRAPQTFTYHPADSAVPGMHQACFKRSSPEENLTQLQKLALRENQPVEPGERRIIGS